MESIITSADKFNKVKQYLDGYVFWREVANGIEIKFIKSLKKYIDNSIITFLNTK